MYYEPKEFENLVYYFSSPIFNAFLMMENFYDAKEDVFNVFRIEDEKMKDYFNLCLEMFEKEKIKKSSANEIQDSKANTSP
jgi:hypothetical protein